MPTYYELHKEEYDRKARERYYKDKESYKVRAWRNHLLRDYGLTETEYKDLWDSQNGECWICHSSLEMTRRKPHVDHDHQTGEIRGILCANCNRGLGAFKDDPELLLRAIDYLRKE